MIPRLLRRCESERTTAKAYQHAQVVTKGLLQQDDLPLEMVAETIVTVCKKENDLTGIEKKMLVRLCNTLRPFVPQSTTPRWPVLLLPAIINSNMLQRVAGYSQFTREFLSQFWPVPSSFAELDAGAIYELFGSKQANFDLLDQQTQTINLVSKALGTNLQLFAPFFESRKVCLSRLWAQIQDVLIVTPNGMARLFGLLQNEVQPSMSAYNAASKNSFHSQERGMPLSKRERQNAESDVSFLNVSIKPLQSDTKQK